MMRDYKLFTFHERYDCTRYIHHDYDPVERREEVVMNNHKVVALTEGIARETLLAKAGMHIPHVAEGHRNYVLELTNTEEAPILVLQPDY